MKSKHSMLEDLTQLGRGFLMGGADIIPGVSGGTVALIVGIYDRLVTAVSHFDLQFLGHLKDKQWNAAARHVDLRFLIALGSGIVLGIGALASLMHSLLQNHLQLTFAGFFGLIIASSVLVAKTVHKWSPQQFLCLVGGAIVFYWVVGLPILRNPPQGNLYAFFCGMIAICAMILPGISGAFLLLVLGVYGEITGLLRDFLHFDFTVPGLLTLTVFTSGCLIGLISFSKFLRWLLVTQESTTMALLCGIMVGSARKIWPFQKDMTPDEIELKRKQLRSVWPETYDGQFIAVLLVALLAAGLVFLLDWLTHRHSTPEDEQFLEPDHGESP